MQVAVALGHWLSPNGAFDGAPDTVLLPDLRLQEWDAVATSPTRYLPISDRHTPLFRPMGGAGRGRLTEAGRSVYAVEPPDLNQMLWAQSSSWFIGWPSHLSQWQQLACMRGQLRLKHGLECQSVIASWAKYRQ